MQNKFTQLKNYLIKLNEQGLCLAFSGGIDSTVLLYLCRDLNLIAVTFKSVFQTEEEIAETINICKFYRVKHQIIEYFPLEDEIIKNNPKDRCYYCKMLMFLKLKDFADRRNIIDGTNADDLKVYRPGVKALKELRIISPLAEFGITKNEIRTFAQSVGIKIFDKPSTPCIATRFPYGTCLDEGSINKVKEGEKALKELGFNSCRLRLHNDIARIEIPERDFDSFLKKKNKITGSLKSIGFRYITLDMEAIRSGFKEASI